MSSNCLTVSTTTASVRPSAWITWVAPGPIRRDLTALPASAIAGSSSNCQARLPYGFASSFAPFPAARHAHQPFLFVLILVLLSRSATARCAAALDPPAGLLRFKVPAPGPHRAPRPLPPVLTILPQQAAGPQLVPLRHRGRFRPLLLHLPALPDRIKNQKRRSRRGRSNFRRFLSHDDARHRAPSCSVGSGRRRLARASGRPQPVSLPSAVVPLRLPPELDSLVVRLRPPPPSGRLPPPSVGHARSGRVLWS